MLEKAKTKSAGGQPKGKARGADSSATKAATTAAPRAPVAARHDDDLRERIQQRAYELWDREGRPHGREQAHWQQAEREIRENSASGLAGSVSSSTSAAAARAGRGRTGLRP